MLETLRYGDNFRVDRAMGRPVGMSRFALLSRNEIGDVAQFADVKDGSAMMEMLYRSNRATALVT